MIEQKTQAFKHEFYGQAKSQQVIDDLTSYLGEYRFNVSDFNYKIRIVDGRLLDPNTSEDMEDKGQKAIEEREKNHLSTKREIAEKIGLSLIRVQLDENPRGVVVWFSPPGDAKDGYGEYGFGFVGKINDSMLEMTAIRLENPKISDFNKASAALWGENYTLAEDFLKSPKVVDMDPNIVKEFIHGNFEIRDQKTVEIFKKSLSKLKGAIDYTARIIRLGTEKEIRNALNTLENLSLEIKGRFESSLDEKVIFASNFKMPDFATAMSMQRYLSTPIPVFGSCGMSGKIESSNIFGKLIGSSENGLFNKNNQEWFTCPKCTYKADGPVGNRCPGCGLTKEQFVESGGEACD